MLKHVSWRLFRAAGLVAVIGVLVGASTALAGPRTVPSGGTAVIAPNALGTGDLQFPEFPAVTEENGEPVVNRARPGFKNGKFPKNPLDAPVVASSTVASTNPGLGPSFNGLRHRDQRLANGGNQFSLEPPDQGLCVGNGFVVEPVNDVLRVFNTAGAPLTGVQDMNTFYGYPAQFNRTTGQQGPFVTDPVCYFDPVSGRFTLVVLTLDVVPSSGRFTGRNHLDIAVSNTANPTGSWTIYRIPAQDDGTEGTPNHNCPPGPNSTRPGVTNPNACFGDFPHIGADANGIYITTNEYALFGDSFNGAQIYAIGKSQLQGFSLPSSLSFVHLENTSVDGSPGFTVWPATSPHGQYSTEAGGTEFFLSTIAGDGSETGNPTGTARRIGIWAVTNTSSLNSASPSLGLTSRLINSETYVFPPKSNQKPGDFPLGQCINDTTAPTLFGPGCWRFIFVNEPAHNEVESTPDSSDTRIESVWFTNGVLWGTADTAVNVGGQLKAGVAWFAVEPKINGAGKIEGKIANQGYVALANNNLTYPAIAVLPSGKGLLAFTVVGGDFFPSAGYAQVDAASGTVGDIHIAGAGLGPTDGFTSYKSFVGSPPRTRWGDYGAAITDGSDIWFASEFIGQTCTLAQYMSAPFGSCGATRTSLGNWFTRISKVTP